VRPPPIIYNLFPTLAGPLDTWAEHAQRVAGMGFNWLYVNPVHAPGFSGSLYAIKDHRRLHPALVPAGESAELGTLRPVVAAIREAGLGVILDLVVNHTARDNPLVTRRPGWFRRDASGRVQSPSAIDPADADRVTTWGDLAEVDNAGAADREGLWAYWEALTLAYLDLGVTGFRCDAAYKVPAELWRRLIGRVKERTPSAIVLAETLGCRLEEVEALGEAGFDYLYNSSKWWDFREPWCLEQHELFRRIAPSVSFPESHDTERLAAETDGSEAVQRQRYAFAAAFSAGLQTTVGYEYGFRRRLHVVETRPADWERPAFDLCRFIGRMNALKRRHPLLAGEGVLRPVDRPPGDAVVLERWSDASGRHRGLVLVNTSRLGAADVTLAPEAVAGRRLWRPCRDGEPAAGVPAGAFVRLDPAEVALVMEAA